MHFLRASELAARILPALTVLLVIIWSWSDATVRSGLRS